MIRSPRQFLSRWVPDAGGILTVDLVVLGGAVMLIAMAALSVVKGGAGDRSGAVVAELASADPNLRPGDLGRDPEAELAAGPRLSMSRAAMVDHFHAFADPSRRSDSAVFHAYRHWSRNAANPRFRDPGLALDWVRLLEQAMQARGLAL